MEESRPARGLERRAAGVQPCRPPRSTWLRGSGEMAGVITRPPSIYRLSSQPPPPCTAWISSHSARYLPSRASCPQPGAVTQGFCHRHRGFEPRASGPAAPLVFIPAANAGIILHLANAINFPVGKTATSKDPDQEPKLQSELIISRSVCLQATANAELTSPELLFASLLIARIIIWLTPCEIS